MRIGKYELKLDGIFRIDTSTTVTHVKDKSEQITALSNALRSTAEDLENLTRLFNQLLELQNITKVESFSPYTYRISYTLVKSDKKKHA